MVAHLDFEPLTLGVVALGVAVAIRIAAGSTPRAEAVLVRLSVYLCGVGTAVVTALLVCFALGAAPMTTQERIAAVALLMSLVGGILFALVYARGGGEGGFGRDDEAPDPRDDPGGNEAHPWWPEFERELREYERERSTERELALTRGDQRSDGRRD